MASYPCNCGGETGHIYGCALFTCCGCGKQADVSPDDGPTYCADCCPDHEYQYERSERGYRCVTCSAEPPHDWHRHDFD